MQFKTSKLSDMELMDMYTHVYKYIHIYAYKVKAIKKKTYLENVLTFCMYILYICNVYVYVLYIYIYINVKWIMTNF